jgi:hypothetical protein
MTKISGTSARTELATVELPARGGLSGPTLATAAAVVGCAAIGLGAWGVTRAVTSDSGGAAIPAAELAPVEQVTALLAKPTTARLPLRHSGGHIVLAAGADGIAGLVLDGLAPAPTGRTYQAWVVRRGSRTPLAAGVFSGSEPAVPLTAVVPPAATVGVTVEQEGGASAPSRALRIAAMRPKTP